MPTRNYKPEQIVGVLRQIEVQMASGHAAGVAGGDPRGVGAGAGGPGGAVSVRKLN